MSTNVTIAVSLADAAAIREGTDPGATADAVASITKSIVEALKSPRGTKRRAASPDIPVSAPPKATKTEERPKILLTFRNYTGKNYDLSVQASATTKEVILLLSEATGRSIDEMRLIYKGEQLEYGRKMQDVVMHQMTPGS